MLSKKKKLKSSEEQSEETLKSQNEESLEAEKPVGKTISEKDYSGRLASEERIRELEKSNEDLLNHLSLIQTKQELMDEGTYRMSMIGHMNRIANALEKWLPNLSSVVEELNQQTELQANLNGVETESEEGEKD